MRHNSSVFAFASTPASPALTSQLTSQLLLRRSPSQLSILRPHRYSVRLSSSKLTSWHPTTSTNSVQQRPRPLLASFPLLSSLTDKVISNSNPHSSHSLSTNTTIVTSSTPRINEIKARISALPLVLCIREDDFNVALRAAHAALNGGIRVIEVTLTTPEAPRLISSLIRDYPDAIIGAGTVLTCDDVNRIHEAGALFAMSPVTDVDIISHIHKHDMLAIPGACTPTEVWYAHNTCKAQVVKIFPISSTGDHITFVNAMNGPLSQIPLLPTSRIEFVDIESYMRLSNVFGIGVSRQILNKKYIKDKEWDEISKVAKLWVDKILTFI